MICKQLLNIKNPRTTLLFSKNTNGLLENKYLMFILVSKHWFLLDLALESKHHKSHASNDSHPNPSKLEAKEERGREEGFSFLG